MIFQLLVKKGLKIVPFLFLMISFETSFAASSQSLKMLADSKEWKNLLRYERSLLSPWRNNSAVSSKGFFLSPIGNWDSLAEMNATLEAFNLPIEQFKNPNDHALCRFPARYKWLKKNLGFKKNRHNELKKCSDYQRWNEYGQVKSISIYFATGYFENPASFFGHPLLKFNRSDGKSKFVDTALNYGALTPENEDPILYVLKGLFGGYTASFTRHDFFYHNHNYSETEMRDLWEYRLNLDTEEVQTIVDRTWELLGKNHSYYFLIDNCAYRMAELLEDIFKKPLFFRNRLYAIPIDFFDNLAKGYRQDGRPMVSSVNIIPSRYTRLFKMYLSLSAEEKALVHSFIKDNSQVQQAALQKRSTGSQAKIVETLINYYSFRKLKEKNNQEIEAKRVMMIRERFKIKGKSGFQSLSYQDVSAPHKSVNSFGFRIMQGYSDFLGSFHEITIRPALYDELNPSVARPDNTSLEIFKTRMRLYDSKLTLRSLEVFRISTIGASRIDLPGMGNMAWKVRLGLRSQTQSCQNCLVAFAEGGIGSALFLWKGISVYSLLKVGIQNNRNGQGTLYVLPEVGTYIKILKNWKIFASYEHEKFINGSKTGFNVWTLESRFGSSKWWDLRISYQNRDDKQILAGLWFYL